MSPPPVDRSRRTIHTPLRSVRGYSSVGNSPRTFRKKAKLFRSLTVSPVSLLGSVSRLRPSSYLSPDLFSPSSTRSRSDTLPVRRLTGRTQMGRRRSRTPGPKENVPYPYETRPRDLRRRSPTTTSPPCPGRTGPSRRPNRGTPQGPKTPLNVSDPPDSKGVDKISTT